MNRRDLFKALTAAVPVAATVATLTVEPEIGRSDLLIVELDDWLDESQCARLRATIMEAFPKGTAPPILVVERGIRVRVERGVARVENIS